MARGLAEVVKRMPKLDWTRRQIAKADLRRKVRRLLGMYGYPPDLSDPWSAIGRHSHGQWGDLPPEDLAENERGLVGGGRLVSAWNSDEGIRFWAITESDRSVTTVLLPQDY